MVVQWKHQNETPIKILINCNDITIVQGDVVLDVGTFAFLLLKYRFDIHTIQWMFVFYDWAHPFIFHYWMEYFDKQILMFYFDCSMYCIYISGSYCPTGSSSPTPCPAGKYTNSTRTVTCLDCPIGHYCVLGTSDPVPCPEGYWCPVQSVSANLYPCAIGTFLNTTGGQAAANCLSCSPGYRQHFVFISIMYRGILKDKFWGHWKLEYMHSSHLHIHYVILKVCYVLLLFLFGSIICTVFLIQNTS